MSARLPGALAVLLFAAVFALLAATLPAPALAVEEGGAEAEEEPPPDIEELCEEGTIAEEFCPETYHEPSWFQWLIYPMLGLGLLVIIALLVFYLWWQPRFAREREQASRGR